MARILIVDDSPFMARCLAVFLEDEGHEVVAVGGDGFEGIFLFRRHRPDLTLLDITMPNRDGRDCLDDILAEDPHARVMMISAIRDMAVILQCLRAGARAYLPKPLVFSRHACRDMFRSSLHQALQP